MDVEKTLRDYLPWTQTELFAAAITFTIYVVAAKVGIYIFFQYDTSPAVIWPAIGIAFIAVAVGGYKMWLPIFLAQLVTGLTSFPDAPFFYGFVYATAITFQSTFGYSFMRRLGFKNSMNNLSTTLIFVSSTFLVTAISPAIATAFLWSIDGLVRHPWLEFSQSWAGGIFSMLVLAPVALPWQRWWSSIAVKRSRTIELVGAFILLLGVNYFVFWTSYTQYVGISVIFFLPIVLIWFALRFHPRWTALGLCLTAIQGVAGTLILNPSGNSIRDQLLSVEIYIGLIGAILLVFAAVVEERRNTFRRLQNAYNKLTASDTAKTEFIAILAHELRNPLATIVSSIELLKMEFPQSEMGESFSRIEDETKMMKRLLDDLLDTVRLTKGTFELQRETVALDQLIDQSLESIADCVAEKNHTLTVSCQVMPQLFVDPVRVKQIIINLLMNACKYTHPGGTIGLSTRVSGNEVVIEIQDNGVGLDTTNLEQIFEPFEQVRTASEQSAGLGIGLYITKRLLEMHNGRIEVESTLGEGSTFRVYLPVIENEVITREAPKTTVAKNMTKKILVVDDNKTAADLMTKLLIHSGLEAKASYSGAEALETYKNLQPDYILLDIGMPGMDGHAVAVRLRQEGYHASLIALTGYSQEADRIRVKESGFDHHLVKPVGVAEVLDVLDLSAENESFRRKLIEQ